MKELLKTKTFSVVETVVSVKGKSSRFNVIRKNDVSVILPVLPDGRLLLERQKRHQINRYLYELPAGTMDEGEKPEETAARELKEETGYSAKSVKFLFKGYSSPGTMDETFYFYLAKGLSKGKPHRDPDEIISLRKVTLHKALLMIKNGEIIDTKTAAGVLYYKNFC